MDYQLLYTYTNYDGDVISVEGDFITAYCGDTGNQLVAVLTPVGDKGVALARAILTSAGNTGRSTPRSSTGLTSWPPSWPGCVMTGTGTVPRGSPPAVAAPRPVNSSKMPAGMSASSRRNALTCVKRCATHLTRRSVLPARCPHSLNG